MRQLGVGALGYVAIGGHKRRGISKVEAGVSSEKGAELGESAPEPGRHDELVHLPPNALDFLQAQRVNGRWRGLDRSVPLDVVRVDAGALGQRINARRGAAPWQVPSLNKLLESLECGSGGFPVRRNSAHRQFRAIGLSDRRRPGAERSEQRAFERVVGQLALDLTGHIPQGDSWRRHSRRKPLLHQRHRLVDERPNSPKAPHEVLVVVARRSWGAGKRSRDILLDTLELIERHEKTVRRLAGNGHRVVVKGEPCHGRIEEAPV